MARGRFREFYQCDFDIAGLYGLMIPDAEVLKVFDQIFTALDIGPFVIKVNNRKLLDAMVEKAKCPKDKYKLICSSIDKLDKEPWEVVKDELINQKGLSEQMCADLYKFVQLKSEPGKAMELLEKMCRDKLFEGSEMGDQALKEMGLLFNFLKDLDALSNISFDLSMARGLDYYTGLIFEAVLISESGKGVGSVCGGGRYDNLVGMFSGKKIPAIGGSVGIERILSILEAKYQKSGTVRTNSCECYVASIGSDLTSKRFEILNQLWNADIKAETSYKTKPKTARQIEHVLKA